jgi:hypothetical protein
MQVLEIDTRLRVVFECCGPRVSEAVERFRRSSATKLG